MYCCSHWLFDLNSLNLFFKKVHYILLKMKTSVQVGFLTLAYIEFNFSCLEKKTPPCVYIQMKFCRCPWCLHVDSSRVTLRCSVRVCGDVCTSISASACIHSAVTMVVFLTVTVGNELCQCVDMSVVDTHHTGSRASHCRSHRSARLSLWVLLSVSVSVVNGLQT